MWLERVTENIMYVSY